MNATSSFEIDAMFKRYLGKYAEQWTELRLGQAWAALLEWVNSSRDEADVRVHFDTRDDYPNVRLVRVVSRPALELSLELEYDADELEPEQREQLVVGEASFLVSSNFASLEAFASEVERHPVYRSLQTARVNDSLGLQLEPDPVEINERVRSKFQARLKASPITRLGQAVQEIVEYVKQSHFDGELPNATPSYLTCQWRLEKGASFWQNLLGKHPERLVCELSDHDTGVELTFTYSRDLLPQGFEFSSSIDNTPIEMVIASDFITFEGFIVRLFDHPLFRATATATPLKCSLS